MILQDEGDGFAPDEVANPLEGEHLLRDHGRGLLMIRAYVDEAYHSEGGTRLTMVKYLNNDGGSAASDEGDSIEL